MNTTQDTVRAQSEKDPAELEREIDQQRRHIEGIVQALENKLSPGEIFDRVLSFGKGTGREFAGNLATTVKQNPMPALLTAAGLLWLYSSTRQSQAATGTSLMVVESEATIGGDGAYAGGEDGSRGVGDRLRAAKSAVGEKAHGAASSLRSGAQSVRSGARSATESVRSGVHRAKDGYGTMLQENPLAAGAIAIALGAVLGALIPPTRREDEMLGEASDRLGDRLKARAREQKDRLAGHAREMTSPREGDDRPSSGTTSAGASSPASTPGAAAPASSPTGPYGAGRAH